MSWLLKEYLQLFSHRNTIIKMKLKDITNSECRRLCIFSIYDPKGVVAEYKLKHIEKIGEICDRVIVVINGEIDDTSFSAVKSYPKTYVYIRDNTDYDAGAYKHVLLNVVLPKELLLYDELILMNDTFYGPFISWYHIFGRMASEDVDFWGISRGGGTAGHLSHIQAYFIVFKRTMFKAVRSYFEGLSHFSCVHDVVLNHEYKLTWHFTELGYACTTYLDVVNNNYEPTDHDANYAVNPYALLTKYNCPVLKRKGINVLCYENSIKAMDYLRNNTKYDVRLIERDVKRLDDDGDLRPYSFREIDDFCAKYRDIYIYGKGVIGNRMANYFECKHKKYKGFLVTHRSPDSDKNVFEYRRDMINPDTGIIVAVIYPAIEEISAMLKKEINDEQVIYPRL